MPRFNPRRWRARRRGAPKQLPDTTRDRRSKIFLRRVQKDAYGGKLGVGGVRRAGPSLTQRGTVLRSVLSRDQKGKLYARSMVVQAEPRVLVQLYESRTGGAAPCEQRAARQGVLFAKGIAGRAGGSPGKHGTYKRTEESKISCERRF